MTAEREVVPIQVESDIVRVRQLVRNRAMALKLSLVEQTKVVTAASEVARNTLIYGKGGKLLLENVVNESNIGLKLTFEDEGPGIANIEQALRDGYTSGNGLGMGLGGSKRLVNEFQIESEVGKGTRVTLIKWKGR